MPFDPSKPYTAAPSPGFDPSKPFTPAPSARAPAPRGRGTLTDPYDLSGGQSRDSIPRGSYFRWSDNSVRRNDNGDKGNPIIEDPKGRSVYQPVSADALRLPSPPSPMQKILAAPRGSAKDAAISAPVGVFQGLAGIADQLVQQASPTTTARNILNMGAGWADIYSKIPGLPQTAKDTFGSLRDAARVGRAGLDPLVPKATAPLRMIDKAVTGAGGGGPTIAPLLDYKAPTTAGRYAQAIGQNAPLLATGAGAARVPALIAGTVGAGVGSQGGQDLARALGAGPEVQEMAGQAGGLALGLGAGAATGIRPEKVTVQAPSKQLSPAQALISEGVQPTVGQRVPLLKGPEQAMTSIPLLGDQIKVAQGRGIESFNIAALNRALEPIGQKLPSNIKAGPDAVTYAGDLLSKGYDELLPRASLTADPAFLQSLDDIRSEGRYMPDQYSGLVSNVIDDMVLKRLTDGRTIDGTEFKLMDSALGTKATRYLKSNDAAQQEAGAAIRDVQAELRDLLQRSNPEIAEPLGKLNLGWAYLSTAERAASQASGNSQSGVFTPRQYMNAVKAGDATVRHRGIARGQGLGQDLAANGIKVLAPTLPDSGTATRAMYGAGLGIAASGGAAHFVNPTVGAATLAAMAPYTKIGQAAINNMGRPRVGPYQSWRLGYESPLLANAPRKRIPQPQP